MGFGSLIIFSNPMIWIQSVQDKYKVQPQVHEKPKY
jgi:hypothetical protein